MKSLKYILTLSILSAVTGMGFVSCTKSESKSDPNPTILALAANGLTARGNCGVTVSLMNSCIGGTGTGQYFDPGPICRIAEFDSAAITKCVSKKVAELDCTNPSNKFAVKTDSIFKNSFKANDAGTGGTYTISGTFGACFLEGFSTDSFDVNTDKGEVTFPKAAP